MNARPNSVSGLLLQVVFSGAVVLIAVVSSASVSGDA